MELELNLNGFEKDWAIYFHGWVRDENVDLLGGRRESGFENRYGAGAVHCR